MYSRPPVFSPQQQQAVSAAAKGDTGDMVSRDKLLRTQLGFDVSDSPHDGDYSDEEVDSPAKNARPSSSSSSSSAMAAAYSGPTTSSSLSRSLGGAGFGGSAKSGSNTSGDNNNISGGGDGSTAPHTSSSSHHNNMQAMVNSLEAEKALLLSKLDDAIASSKSQTGLLKKAIIKQMRDKDAILEQLVSKIVNTTTASPPPPSSTSTSSSSSSSSPLAEEAKAILARAKQATENTERGTGVATTTMSNSNSNSNSINSNSNTSSTTSNQQANDEKVAKLEQEIKALRAFVSASASATTSSSASTATNQQTEETERLAEFHHATSPLIAGLLRDGTLTSADIHVLYTALVSMSSSSSSSSSSSNKCHKKSSNSNNNNIPSSIVELNPDVGKDGIPLLMTQQQQQQQQPEKQQNSVVPASPSTSKEEEEARQQQLLAAARTATADAEARSIAAEQKSLELHTQLKISHERIKALETTIDAMKADQQQGQDVNLQIVALEKQLKEMEDNHRVTSAKAAADALHATEGKIQSLRTSLEAQHKKEISKLEEELAAVRVASAAAVEGNNKVKEDSTAAALAEVAALKKQLAETVAHAARELEEQKQQHHLLLLAETKKVHDEASSTQAAAQQQLVSCEKEIKELKESLRSITADATSSAASAAALLSTKDVTITALQTNLQELDSQLTRAKTEAKAKESSFLEQLATKEASLATQQTALSTELAAAKQALETAKISSKAKEEKIKTAAKTQFEELKTKFMAELDAKQKEASDTIDQLTATHAAESLQLRNEVSTLRSSSLGLSRKLKQLFEVVASLRSQHSSLSAQAKEEKKQVMMMLASLSSTVDARFSAHVVAYNNLIQRYRKELAERRKLFNTLQELKGNIRVFCRVRPALPFELEGATANGSGTATGGFGLLQNSNSIATRFREEGEISVMNSKKHVKTWEFDAVFQPTSTNEGIFKEVEGLVTSVLDGYNVCIFAYGQTGSGKTFTMEGSSTSPGINYRTLDTLFALAAERKDTTRYDISVSMLEIYNEGLKDMLTGSVYSTSGGGAGSSNGLATPPPKLTIREGPQGMFVPDLTIARVTSREEVLALMLVGYSTRSTFATNMNEHSSRSHCVLSVYVVATSILGGAGGNTVVGSGGGSGGGGTTTTNISRGKLHLIDLAGSERVGKSGATGDRLKEAQAINKSLSALGDVIQARGAKRSHVPYRNSSLTMLLADSLSADSKTLMIVAVSPVLSNADETYCSLNFASRARAVELGKATKHVSSSISGNNNGAGGGNDDENTGEDYADDDDDDNNNDDYNNDQNDEEEDTKIGKSSSVSIGVAPPKVPSAPLNVGSKSTAGAAGVKPTSGSSSSVRLEKKPSTGR